MWGGMFTDYFNRIVEPAWAAYLGAEVRLNKAVTDPDAAKLELAEWDALREGASASIFMHQAADYAFTESPDWVPDRCASVADVRSFIEGYCTHLRSDRPAKDVELLAAVADSLKHAVLTRKADTRPITSHRAVLVISTGFSASVYGEGKFGGAPEVRIQTRTGESRALSAVIQNVADAWRKASGLSPLPPIAGLPPV